MRADRLLSILLLLQVHGRLTTRELARRLGVSDRTIHRDMGALSVAGVPVVADRGASGGWSLLEEYRTNLTGLNPAEVQALALTGPSHVLADLGLGEASQAAFIKLLAALPTLGRRDAEYMRQRIYVDMTGWQRYEEAMPYLTVIQDALWQDHRLQLSYQRTDGNLVERVVDPLGLVAKMNVWYLIAAVDGEPRTYRVSRVQAVHPVDEPAVRPKNFDLAAFWEQSKADFKATLPRYPVTLRAAPRVLERLRTPLRFARVEKVTPADPPGADGWVIASVSFEREDDAAECVLSFGPQAEVLDPPELRQRVVELAQALVAFYTRKTD